MARGGVGYFEVADACDTMVAQGVPPTVDRVRQAVGDTGSRTTISKYLREWRSRYEQKRSSATLTDKLSDVLSEQSSFIYSAIEEAVAKKFQGERDTYLKKISELESTLETLKLQLQETQTELDIATKSIAQKQSDITRISAEYSEQKSITQQRELSLAKKTAQLDDANRNIIRTHETEKQLREEMRLATLRIGSLSANCDALRRESEKKDAAIETQQHKIIDLIAGLEQKAAAQDYALNQLGKNMEQFSDTVLRRIPAPPRNPNKRRLTPSRRARK